MGYKVFLLFKNLFSTDQKVLELDLCFNNFQANLNNKSPSILLSSWVASVKSLLFQKFGYYYFCDNSFRDCFACEFFYSIVNSWVIFITNDYLMGNGFTIIFLIFRLYRNIIPLIPKNPVHPSVPIPDEEKKLN